MWLKREFLVFFVALLSDAMANAVSLQPSALSGSRSRAELIPQLKAWLSDLKADRPLMGSELPGLTSLAFEASMIGAEAKVAGENKSVPTMTPMTSFAPLMLDFQRGINKTHAKTQMRLTKLDVSPGLCKAKLSQNKRHQHFEKQLSAHRQCRQGQHSAQLAANECDALARALKSDKHTLCNMPILKYIPTYSCNPADGLTYKSWVSTQSAYYDKKHNEFSRANTACKQKTKEQGKHSCKTQHKKLNDYLSKCENLNNKLQGTACAYATTDIACKSYDDCFKSERDGFESIVVEARTEEASHKVQWRATQRFTCLFGAIDSSGLVIMDKFNKCIDIGTYSTVHLSYTYPKFPVKKICYAPNVRPGSVAYLRMIYLGLPKGMRLASPKNSCPIPANKLKESVLVLDRLSTGCSRILKCHDFGSCTTIIGCEGTASGAADLSVRKDGSFLLADATQHRVVKCSACGSSCITLRGNYTKPAAVYAGHGSSYVVVDEGSNNIQQCVGQNTFLNRTSTCRSIADAINSTSNTCPSSHMSSPSSFVVDPIDGDYLVTSTSRNRVQKCSKLNRGNCVTIAGDDKCQAGRTSGQLSSPRKVVVDRDGSYLVLDSGNDRILKCNRAAGPQRNAKGLTKIEQLQRRLRRTREVNSRLARQAGPRVQQLWDETNRKTGKTSEKLQDMSKLEQQVQNALGQERRNDASGQKNWWETKKYRQEKERLDQQTGKIISEASVKDTEAVTLAKRVQAAQEERYLRDRIKNQRVIEQVLRRSLRSQKRQKRISNKGTEAWKTPDNLFSHVRYTRRDYCRGRMRKLHRKFGHLGQLVRRAKKRCPSRTASSFLARRSTDSRRKIGLAKAKNKPPQPSSLCTGEASIRRSIMGMEDSLDNLCQKCSCRGVLTTYRFDMASTQHALKAHFGSIIGEGGFNHRHFARQLRQAKTLKSRREAAARDRFQLGARQRQQLMSDIYHVEKELADMLVASNRWEKEARIVINSRRRKPEPMKRQYDLFVKTLEQMRTSAGKRHSVVMSEKTQREANNKRLKDIYNREKRAAESSLKIQGEKCKRFSGIKWQTCLNTYYAMSYSLDATNLKIEMRQKENELFNTFWKNDKKTESALEIKLVESSTKVRDAMKAINELYWNGVVNLKTMRKLEHVNELVGNLKKMRRELGEAKNALRRKRNSALAGRRDDAANKYKAQLDRFERDRDITRQHKQRIIRRRVIRRTRRLTHFHRRLNSLSKQKQRLDHTLKRLLNRTGTSRANVTSGANLTAGATVNFVANATSGANLTSRANIVAQDDLTRQLESVRLDMQRLNTRKARTVARIEQSLRELRAGKGAAAKTGKGLSAGCTQFIGSEQLDNPTDLIVDIDGSYLIADAGNKRILRCTKPGQKCDTVVDSTNIDGTVLSLGFASGVL